MKSKNTNRFLYILRLVSIILLVVFIIKEKELSILKSVLSFNILSFIPDVLRKFKKIYFNDITLIIYNIFLFIAIILGGGLEFYDLFYWWDVLVHTVSGIFFTSLGLFLFKRMGIPSRYLILVVFMFVSTSTLIWEVLEFIIDSIFKTNLQEWKDMTKEFAPLVNERGHGLVDSMLDSIYAIVGFLIAIFHYIIYKRWRKFD